MTDPAPPPHRPRSARATRVLPLLVVLAVTALVHGRALDNGFTLDDRYLVAATHDDGTPNAMVATLRPLGDYLTAPYWAAGGGVDPLYRPLTVWSFAVINALGPGDAAAGDAFVHQLVDLVLQLLATWLAYRLVRTLGATRTAAVLGSAVFGLHGLGAEVSGGTVGRADILAFALGGTACLVGRRGGPGRGVAAALLLLLALLAKEIAIGWVVVLAVARGGGGGGNGGNRARRLGTTAALLAVPLAVWWLLRAAALADLPPDVATSPGVNPLAPLEPAVRVASALPVWAYGIAKCAVPFDPRSDYGVPFFTVPRTFTDPVVWLAAALLVGLGAAAVARRGRRPLRFAAGWLLVFSLPTANLLLPIGTVFADRLGYAAALAGSFVAAWTFDASRSRPTARAVAVVAIGSWLAWNAHLLWTRIPEWRDDATLFAADVAKPDAAARTHYNFAKARERVGDVAGMREHVERAVAKDPNFAAAWNDLGVLRLRDGDGKGAADAWTRGRKSPDLSHDIACELDLNLASLLVRSGQLEPARRFFLRAARSDETRVLRRVAAGLLRGLTRDASAAWVRSLVDAAAAQTDDPDAAARWRRLLPDR